MAEKTEKSVKTTAKTTPTAESIYGIEELVAADAEFKTHKAIIKVALQQTGKTQFTLSEAKGIVEKFKNKEVN